MLSMYERSLVVMLFISSEVTPLRRSQGFVHTPYVTFIRPDWSPSFLNDWNHWKRNLSRKSSISLHFQDIIRLNCFNGVNNKILLGMSNLKLIKAGLERSFSITHSHCNLRIRITKMNTADYSSKPFKNRLWCDSNSYFAKWLPLSPLVRVEPNSVPGGTYEFRVLTQHRTFRWEATSIKKQ